MRIIPRQAETETEAPFRTPEQLALAMPLVAMIGLMVVVSAVATGGAKPVVALVAVGGFGLCAAAPMALIELYVTRPLRGALAELRAARDGRASGAAFASGVVADLVQLARDIQAARAVPVSPLQAETSRAQIVALTEAVKALRAAPDAAVERQEAVLVYIAESLERLEARGGVEGVADLPRLIARETEILQGVISSGEFSLRADIAGAVAEEQLGRAHVLERLDALETRLAARLARPDASDDLRAGQRKIDALMARFDEAGLDGLSAQGDAQARRLDEIERRVLEQILGVGRDRDAATLAAFMQAAGRIGEAAAARSGEAWERLGGDMQGIAKAVEALAASARERLDSAALTFDAAQARFDAAAARMEAGDPGIAEAVRDLICQFQAGAQKLAAFSETETRALRADFAGFVEGQGARIAEAVATAMRGFDATRDEPALRQALDSLRADFAATASAAAARFDAVALDLTRTVEDRVETLRRGELSPAIAAAKATAQELHTAQADLFAHVEALKAALLTDRSGVAALRLDVVEAVAAIAGRASAPLAGDGGSRFR
jgi:hypothetical protein